MRNILTNIIIFIRPPNRLDVTGDEMSNDEVQVEEGNNAGHDSSR
jgi:hypothetical protein